MDIKKDLKCPDRLLLSGLSYKSPEFPAPYLAAAKVDCPIPHCGAKYLVKLSNHLTDVYRLDYIQRRKWLQEAKLQPKIRVVIYPAKASREFRMRSKSKTTLLKQQEGKDTVLYQISTPRKVKKSRKSLTRGTGKAAKNTQHYNRAADSVPERLTL